MSTRPAAVAGSFYPAEEAQLHAMVSQLLAENPYESQTLPKVIIAPHAGYVYSGPTAASVYNLLRPATNQIKHVVLLGPAHRVPLIGMAAPSSDTFSTPLGTINIDHELRDRICAMNLANKSDSAHSLEHSLEVQLPFLQVMLHTFTILPIVVGEASTKEVADLIDTVWGNDETLIVISTDLSHFKNYETATEFDRLTCNEIMKYTNNLQGDQACGCFPLNGMLSLAAHRKMRINLINYRNSGDTAGSLDRVVGYGAFALYEH